LKKKLQKVSNKGKKRRKVRKIEKNDAKRCTIFRYLSGVPRTGAAGAFQMKIDDLQLTIGGVTGGCN